jgi:membrane protease YdiL (CAAX protease family)
MRSAIKYVLAYFAILTFVGPACAAAVYGAYSYLAGGAFTFSFGSPELIIPSQLTSDLLAIIYIYADGKLGVGRTDVKPKMLGWSLTAWIATYWLVSLLTRLLDWVPDIMEQTFDNILSSWGGIVTVALAGPIVEEFVFRRAVTDSLLKSLPKWTSIIISALLFGLIHINPAQIIPAFLLGILFAWIYVTTGSLIPTLLLHVANNSLSVFLMTRREPVDDVTQLFSATPTIALTIASAALLLLSIMGIAKQ